MNINLNIKPVLEKLVGNGISLAWIQDPITKLPSVSLTNWLISIVFVILSILSNYFVCLKGLNAELSLNYFMVSAALYFGRRVSIGGKSAEAPKE